MDYKKFYKKLIQYQLINYILIPIVSSFLLLFITLWIKEQSYDATLTFLSENQEIAKLTFLILLALLYIFYTLFNNLYFSIVIVAVLTLLLSIINEIKLAFLDIALSISDVYQLKQAILIAPNSIGVMNFILAIVGTIIILGLLIWFGIKFKLQAKWKFKTLRIIVLALCLFFLYAVINHNEEPYNKYFQKLGIENQRWNITKAVKQQGILLNLTLNAKMLVAEKPEGYAKNTVQEIAKEFTSEKTPVTDNKPNIIIMMSEAFYDVNKLNVIKDGVDYIPNIRKNQIGEVFVSQYGGGTANVEFEVITSMSMAAYENGTTPYNQYIRKEIPTLPRYLKSLGYETSGFHTHSSAFYNRKSNYSLFGFDNILFKEDLKKPEYSGYYVSDKTMTDLIINQLDSSTDKPQFVFALTMQNHLPYTKNRKGEIETKVDLSKESYNNLKNYTLGIHESDKQFLRLMEYINNSERPTVVYFFGDHLPNLGNNYGAYLESGYIIVNSSYSWSDDETKRMFATPLISYSNFPIERKESFNRVSANYIAVQILNELNLNDHSYPLYNFVEKLHEQYPIYTARYFENSQGKFQKGKVTDDWSKKYEMLQYDILLGKEYSLKN